MMSKNTALIALLLVVLAFHANAFVNSPASRTQGVAFAATRRRSFSPLQALNFGHNDLQASYSNSTFGSLPLQANALMDVAPVVVMEEEEQEPDSELNIWAARGILLIVAMIWATNFPAVKYLETLCFHPPCNHPPSEFALARFGVAGMVSLPLLFRQRRDVILAGFECGVFITLGYITQAIALSSISAGKCAFICSLTVVVVPVAASLIWEPAMSATSRVASVSGAS